MELLERYLQAIGEFLPEETKADTLAELRANLLAEMDEREEVLGRPLVESDVAGILKAHGKPAVVALRYLPQRSLIGPTVYPFYMMTMRKVLPIVVFANFVAEGVRFATSSGESWARALGDFALGVWPSLLITVAIMTAVFAGIELAVTRGDVKAKWNEWDPAKLPAVKTPATPNQTPRSMFKRVIDLSVHCLWMAYVLWVPWHPFWIMGPGVFYLDSLNVALAPVWHTFYALLIVLLVIQLVMKLLALVPGAEGKLTAMKLVTDALGFLAIGWLAWHSTYFVAATGGPDMQQMTEVNHAVNLAFRIVLVICAAGFVKHVWRFAKRSSPIRQWAF